ncbi:putative bifunctional diguanylate cyclase/phosphodiesterase [Pseudoalteromonas marina]|uniref:EAL domain-containing protein n=1 Tax=Pseudoalteromonas marina TaxID=267375 RepID=A0ABT9FK00_9GAMM|nr:EAL domain-containing protein [Pseudoalteromonas marina]MDP2567092.1 EAL domain-containing protein [Pseudoalteromonas marina]
MKKLFTLDTISKKLLFILMSVAFISSSIVTVAFGTYELSSAKGEQIESLNSLSNMMSPNIATALIFEDLEAIQELIKPILTRTDVISAIVTNRTGDIVAKTNSHMLSDNVKHAVEVKKQLTIDGNNVGELVIYANNSYINNRIDFYVKFIISLTLLSFAVSLIISLLLRRRFLSPILYLAQTANDITKSNDYSLRAEQLSNDEVGELTVCFNDMLYTIEQREHALENQVKTRTQELENANSELHRYAYQDGLTDLPNRRFFYEEIQTLISNDNTSFALIFLDLDGFKDVNDSLGHDYGDLLLHHVANRLKACIKDEDIIARLGGDEFTLILKNANQTIAVKVADKIKQALLKPIQLKEETVCVTASIGITLYPEHGSTVEKLVKRADQAMYLSKKKGRNRYEFFSYSIEEKATEKRKLIEEIKLGLKESQFELYYQPIFSVDGKSITKAEALIRWNHPQKGLIGPNEFIPMAEKNGLISDIGRWVKSQAIQDCTLFNKISKRLIQVSVNTSPLEIDRSGEWVEQWIQASEQFNLPGHSVLIEVTENTLMGTDSEIKRQLKRLSEFQIDVAIDDFGVGYSSLAYLQRLDIDILKIDRSFIKDIEKNDNSIALVRAIITMAHNLNVEVVAEGVEKQEQYMLLKQMQCDYIQGYYFSKPVSKKVFVSEFIEE